MYICKYCGHTTQEISTYMEEVGDGTMYAGEIEQQEDCPMCHSDLVKARKCEICGEWFCPDDLYGEVCQSCLENKIDYQTVLEYADQKNDRSGLLETIFDEGSITFLLSHAAEIIFGTELGKKCYTESLKEYAFWDLNDFGKFISKKENQ